MLLIPLSFLDDNAKNSRIYNIPVLAGSAYVGQLYDAKTGKLMHDRFLWQNPVGCNEAMITSVESKTMIVESLRDRMFLMDINFALAGTLMEFITVSKTFIY